MEEAQHPLLFKLAVAATIFTFGGVFIFLILALDAAARNFSSDAQASDVSANSRRIQWTLIAAFCLIAGGTAFVTLLFLLAALTDH